VFAGDENSWTNDIRQQIAERDWNVKDPRSVASVFRQASIKRRRTRVFVSYSGHDEELIRPLVQLLRLGHVVFWAKDSIRQANAGSRGSADTLNGVSDRRDEAEYTTEGRREHARTRSLRLPS
jgi:hypothetical protein